MEDSPVLSRERVHKIERSEVDYMVDRMRAIKERENNPEGVEIAFFGRAVAFYSRTMPWPQFNTVKSLTSDDADRLDDIIDFYASKGRAPQFEIVPSSVNGDLMNRLSARGYYPSGHHTSMYMIPSAFPLSFKNSRITIRNLGRDEFATYATIHCRGFGLPGEGIPHIAQNNSILHGRPGWRFYVACWDDEPAAVGVLYVHDGTASLTFAATLPEHRNRGLHRALLETRIREAIRCGCNLVVGQCAYLSQSHRNMERAGMKIGYVRTTWIKRGEDDGE